MRSVSLRCRLRRSARAWTPGWRWWWGHPARGRRIPPCRQGQDMAGDGIWDLRKMGTCADWYRLRQSSLGDLEWFWVLVISVLRFQPENQHVFVWGGEFALSQFPGSEDCLGGPLQPSTQRSLWEDCGPGYSGKISSQIGSWNRGRQLSLFQRRGFHKRRIESTPVTHVKPQEYQSFQQIWTLQRARL